MKAGVKAKETREAILDATDQLLARYGYKKMTIDDLAAEVGIGKGSIYLHFASKEEIVLSHIDRIVERLNERLRGIAGRPIPAAEKIRQMMLLRVMFRFDAVQHYTQSLNDLLSALRAKLLVRRAKYFEEESAIFSSVLREGMASGEIAQGDPKEVSETLLLGTNALLPYSLSAKELGERKELESKTLKIAQLFLRGLLASGK